MPTSRHVATPSLELLELVRDVYPLIVSRSDARVSALALAHDLLTVYATRQGLDPEDWPDMALRVMLEYDRG